ncbi:TraB/GumN family protein [Desulfobacterales bacterium HSG2]|nr:TraB/GumN family protein [Desulfobacterales bacterium HSG2]
MSFKRKIFLLFILPLFLLQFSCASPDNIKVSEEWNPESRTGKSFLWKVRSETAVIYMLGSIHVAKKEFYPLNSTIESAFAECDKLVLEINMDRNAELETAQKMGAAALYKPGDSLDKHISREVKDLLNRYLENAGMPVIVFDRFKPWFVYVSLTMFELQKLGFNPEFGIDRYFQKKAAPGKEILALETVDDQVNMFNSFSDRIQELMLRESLEKMGQLEKMMKDTMTAWKKGDAQAVEDLLLESVRKPEYRPLFQKILVERNRKMVKKIEDYLKTESDYFVVVGALHLVGREGIVDLLRSKGYIVEQSSS